MKTADWRKQQRTTKSEGEEEGALPPALKLPKREKEKQSYPGIEQSRGGRSPSYKSCRMQRAQSFNTIERGDSAHSGHC